VAFIMLFGVVTKLISIVFWILGKVFEVVTILPFISSFDKMLGLILGFAQGLFMLSAILYFLSKYPLNEWLTDQMGHSIVSATLLKMAVVLIPLFPEAIKKLKSVI
ncbi:CvpA family protein, partial [Candidatus Falkowbacteria bacterium]|nr:CvpA family protein [Candidatus Falkowbacteria bacterium]